MTNEDEPFIALRELMLRKASEQIDRHNKAGNPVTQSQALRTVTDNYLDMPKRKAEQMRRGGEKEYAEMILALIRYIPNLIREFGSR